MARSGPSARTPRAHAWLWCLTPKSGQLPGAQPSRPCRAAAQPCVVAPSRPKLGAGGAPFCRVFARAGAAARDLLAPCSPALMRRRPARFPRVLFPDSKAVDGEFKNGKYTDGKFFYCPVGDLQNQRGVVQVRGPPTHTWVDLADDAATGLQRNAIAAGLPHASATGGPRPSRAPQLPTVRAAAYRTLPSLGPVACCPPRAAGLGRACRRVDFFSSARLSSAQSSRLIRAPCPLCSPARSRPGCARCKVKWHPLSEGCLAILTADNVLRFYDVYDVDPTSTKVGPRFRATAMLPCRRPASPQSAMPPRHPRVYGGRAIPHLNAPATGDGSFARV